MQRIDWSLYDWSMRMATRHVRPAPDVVVVAIDEPSFTQIGLPWPWPRSLHAQLVEQIARGGARSIAFDVVFDVETNADDDGAFVEAVGKAGSVVLGADQAAIADSRYQLTQWSEPFPALAAAAAASGAVRIPFDPDGALRRTALTFDGRPTLAAAVAARDPRAAGETPPGEPRLFWFNGPSRLGVETVSYYQAMDADRLLPPGIFRGRHVFVGRSLAAAATVERQTDLFPTPTSLRMPGVEVHATIVDAILRRRWIADPFGRLPALIALCVAAGIAGAAFSRVLSPMAALAAACASVALLGAGSYALLAWQGARVPMFSPALAIVFPYAATAAYRFAVTRKERRLIRRAFQHYVAPAIVDQMLADPSRLRLGGETYDVTVLFSDLEGFTTLSERLGPEGMQRHLSGYFKDMLDRLLAERGTLDKLIGDAIMVYFGCPIPDAQHPFQACRAALEMQRRMVELNARWGAEGLPQLRTRIGINTGSAIAGNMGTDTIFNYTVIGDSVNLASRLEGVNKEYGTLIIVAEDTWSRVRGSFEARELDWIRVKGKTRPVAIYELAAEAGGVGPARRELFDVYADGLAKYRAGAWTDAAVAFSRALEIDPADAPSRVFLDRSRDLAQHPPDAWDGVHVMRTK